MSEVPSYAPLLEQPVINERQLDDFLARNRPAKTDRLAFSLQKLPGRPIEVHQSLITLTDDPDSVYLVAHINTDTKPKGITSGTPVSFEELETGLRSLGYELDVAQTDSTETIGKVSTGELTIIKNEQRIDVTYALMDNVLKVVVRSKSATRKKAVLEQMTPFHQTVKEIVQILDNSAPLKEESKQTQEKLAKLTHKDYLNAVKMVVTGDFISASGGSLESAMKIVEEEVVHLFNTNFRAARDKLFEEQLQINTPVLAGDFDSPLPIDDGSDMVLAKASNPYSVATMLEAEVAYRFLHSRGGDAINQWDPNFTGGRLVPDEFVSELILGDDNEVFRDDLKRYLQTVIRGRELMEIAPTDLNAGMELVEVKARMIEEMLLMDKKDSGALIRQEIIRSCREWLDYKGEPLIRNLSGDVSKFEQQIEAYNTLANLAEILDLADPYNPLWG